MLRCAHNCTLLTFLLSQGLMFGYATDETEECMPLTIVLAHRLNSKMAELRRNGSIPWLRPDSKTQVRSRAVRTHTDPFVSAFVFKGPIILIIIEY